MTDTFVDAEGTARRVRALTVHQPWATLLARGVKLVENRSWFPTEAELAPGDFVLIHAGKTFDPIAWDAARRIAVAEGLAVDILDAMARPLAQLAGVANRKLYNEALRAVQTRAQELVPFGAVVGVAQYAGHVQALGATRFGRWFVGPYGLVLGQAVEIDPVPMQGAQGLFRAPADVFGAVRANWHAARFG